MDLNFTRMQEMQKKLQAKYAHKWGGLSPAGGREHLLWMMVEAGEAADIMKKEGDTQIMQDQEVRKHFVEELCDVMMYFNDVMQCYEITPEELAEVYVEKHERNMNRW